MKSFLLLFVFSSASIESALAWTSIDKREFLNAEKEFNASQSVNINQEQLGGYFGVCVSRLHEEYEGCRSCREFYRKTSYREGSLNRNSLVINYHPRLNQIVASNYFMQGDRINDLTKWVKNHHERKKLFFSGYTESKQTPEGTYYSRKIIDYSSYDLDVETWIRQNGNTLISKVIQISDGLRSTLYCSWYKKAMSCSEMPREMQPPKGC